MSNITITNNQTKKVGVLDLIYDPNAVFTAIAIKTYLEGTLLARETIDETLAVVAAGTGDGTCTAALSAVSGLPLVGAYVLTCLSAVSHGGVFKLEAPSGALLGEFTLTPTTGAVTVIDANGLVLTVTDGATDFVAGDTFTITVAAGSGKFVSYVKGGVGSAGIPKAILPSDWIAAAAQDYPMSALISGRIRQGLLIIEADGDNSNVDDAVLDALRDFTIVSHDFTELNILDNQ